MWNETTIKQLLDSNQKAVERAIVAIYERQTADEKATHSTSKTNGVGFSQYDAEFLSSLAEWIKRGRSLSPRQLAIGRNKIKRYHRQLAEIANSKQSGQPTIEPAMPVAQKKAPEHVAGCTCAENEWYDGEDVCPACHAAGRIPDSVRAAIAANSRSWG
jgi:hypothetical protein